MTDNPSASPQQIIEDSLRMMPAPVAVVGVVHDGIMGGLTAAWVTRVSSDPPLLLVAVGHERFTWELLEGATQFTVSILSEGQVPEARLFGLESRREVDKWARTAHVLLGEGVPALEHCRARYLCRLDNRFTTGDHDCFVGEVVAGEVVTQGPALPLRGSDYGPG